MHKVLAEAPILIEFVQAYGAKEYTKVGVVLQRAMLICCIAFFGIILLWTQIEHGLVLVGTPDCTLHNLHGG